VVEEEAPAEEEVVRVPGVSTEVQTELGAADMEVMDGLADPLALQRTNAVLAGEVQELKDKLHKLQNERKVEMVEANDKFKTVKAENNALKDKMKEMTVKMAKMENAYRDGGRREEELRRATDGMKQKNKDLDSSQAQLHVATSSLAKEQELTFQLQAQFRVEKEGREKDNRLLKLRNLKDQHEQLSTVLTRRRNETEQSIHHLTPFLGQAGAQLRPVTDRLNEFSARLIHALDLLKQRYEELVRNIDQLPPTAPPRLEVDLAGLDSPGLSPTEQDSLRLLALTGLGAGRAPGASFGAPGRAPGFHAPPPPLSARGGVRAPPPGLGGATAPPALSRAPGGPVGGARAPQAPIGPPRAPGPASRASAGPAASPRASPAPSARPPGPPAAARPRAPGGAEGGAPDPAKTKRSSHEKLVEKLKSKYPALSLDNLNKYINILRDQNNGKLSGMSVVVIEQKVGELMRTDQAARGQEPPQAQEANCSVCFEEMSEANSRRLNPCQHRFHNSCINEWMQTSGGAGNTCPMCRHYIVQEDEFPDLGHHAHRRH